MSGAPVTLLVQDLQGLAGALSPEVRLPALERIVARGREQTYSSLSPNHLRYVLLGQEAPAAVPVAALTLASEQGRPAAEGSHWLRMEPVMMRADMTRVFMVESGFQDFDRQERELVSDIVHSACELAGLEAQSVGPQGWCLPLESALAFDFTPLDQALGVDMAEVLPDHPAAAPWKRLMTEIQVELHQADVNAQRRAQGRGEINSVWFWGAGAAPGIRGLSRAAVATSDPVSRGLAVTAGCPVVAPESLFDGATPTQGSLLIDWPMPSRDALAEAGRVESVAAHLLSLGGRPLELVDGSGRAWCFDAASRWRAWRRSRPLATVLGKGRS